MLFKRLELHGFKSFADRTAIDFDAGVTAIVGPNGCGKSNVADAIRWVLGEQSAKSLRGSSMEDFIFGGSAHREPLNFAEVSLVLANPIVPASANENGDATEPAAPARFFPLAFDEITITRRLYRSGESEYLLNQDAVRLKDIQEILMGTGIGTESYSIIEQGRMDSVLNAKPEERRALFEEAAGITKFKAKKKEALRKIEQTEMNLLRVNDIIQEVKRQIGFLERQAKKAEHYRTEFDRLKTMELSAASHEFILFRDKRKTQDALLENLREEESGMAAKLAQMERRCHEGRSALTLCEEALRKAEADEMSASAELRGKQDRILLNRERIGELTEKKENLSRRLERGRKRLEELTAEADNLGREFEYLKKEEGDALTFLSGVQGQFAQLEAGLEEERNRAEEGVQLLSQAAEKKSACLSVLARVQAERAVLASRLEAIQSRANRLLEETRVLEEDVASGGERSASCEKALEDARRVLEAKRSERSGFEALVQKTEEEIARFSALAVESRSKADFLSGVLQRGEGLPSGVRALLEPDVPGFKISGLLGLLADLLEVENGYELALEAALGPLAGAVVFESPEGLLEAAAHLKREKKGRAVLALAAPAGSADASLAAPAGLPFILKHVTAPPNIEALLNRFLSGVAVAENAEQALRLSAEHSQNVFVTRDGERFEGRTVHAGRTSDGGEGSLIGRESRLREWEKALAETQADLERAKAGKEALRLQADTLDAEIRALESELYASQGAAAEARARFQEEEKRLSEMRQGAELLAAESRALQDHENRFADEERVAREELEVLESQMSGYRQAIASYETIKAEKAAEREALLVRLAETRSRQEHCTMRREAMEKDRRWKLESRDGEAEQILIHEKDLQEALSRADQLAGENETLEREMRDLSLARDEYFKNRELRRAERERDIEELAAVESEKETAGQTLASLREKGHALDLQNTQVRFEMDRLHERIFNAYQVDLAVQSGIAEFQEAAAAWIGEAGEWNMEQAKTDIAGQKEKLNRLGPVNLVALEEYDEMKKRHDFLAGQEKDLLDAKADLHQAVLKINRTTRDLFTESFAKIQAFFHEYFRLLFGGGSAELVLQEGEDVLESGIEIIVRPPSKKLQNILLLSGGEKALTAVALVFALFKVRPSPFCVLDEIDAPLDESNVDRFLTALREFLGGSQFILITHNKRTMNLADVLYGITMAESGVSKIVSVRLTAEKKSDTEAVLV